MSSHRPSLCAAAKHRLTSASSVESVLPLVVTRVLIAETIVHASTICLRVRRRRSRLPCPGGGAPRALPGRTGDQPCLLPRLQSRAHRESRLLLGRGVRRSESLLGAARRPFGNARDARPHRGRGGLGAALPAGGPGVGGGAAPQREGAPGGG